MTKRSTSISRLVTQLDTTDQFESNPQSNVNQRNKQRSDRARLFSSTEHGANESERVPTRAVGAPSQVVHQQVVSALSGDSGRAARSCGTRLVSGKTADGLLNRLRLYSISQLSDTELLALFFGGSESSAIPMALQCLERFGSLRRLFATNKSELCVISGIGEARFNRLQVARELVRRSVFEAIAGGEVLSSPGKVREFLALELSGLGYEEFGALLLDNRHRVIEYRALFSGTIDGAAVYPREVLKHCLELNAAAVIFAHNHPSGLAEPSEADISITKKLTAALALVDIRVLDHLIVGNGVQTSLAERGLI